MNEEKLLFALERIGKINGNNKTGQIADWARGIGNDPQLDRIFNAHMTDQPQDRFHDVPAPSDQEGRTYVPDVGDHEGHTVTVLTETDRWCYVECECGAFWRFTSDAAEDASREKHRWGDPAPSDQDRFHDIGARR